MAKASFRVSQVLAGYPDKHFATFHAAASYAAKRSKHFGPATVLKGRTPLMWCGTSQLIKSYGSRQTTGGGAWGKRYAKCTLSTAGRSYAKPKR